MYINRYRFLLGCFLLMGGWFMMCSTGDNAMIPVGKETQPLVYFFHATWCKPCEQMKSESWSKRSVKNLLLQNYQGKKDFDIDTEEAKPYVDYYKIEAVPTTVIVTNYGRELKRKVGFMSEEQLLEFLK